MVWSGVSFHEHGLVSHVYQDYMCIEAPHVTPTRTHAPSPRHYGSQRCVRQGSESVPPKRVNEYGYITARNPARWNNTVRVHLCAPADSTLW